MLFHGEQIVGAIGIWAIPEDCACEFKHGTIKETDIKIISSQTPASHFWFISGLWLRKDIYNKKINSIRMLLSGAINMWIESGHLAYPVEIMAMVSSVEGEAMLNRFSFIQVREASMMADGYPLYLLRVSCKQDLISILKNRYLY